MPKCTNDILAEREKTHGDYSEVAMISQKTKDVWRISRGWHQLNECQRETLEMTATKIARILCGNPNEPDHYRDIAGYNELVVKMLTET